MLDSSLLDPAQFFLRLSELSDEELLDFLIAWHERGETADELSNFANYVFGQQARIETGFDVYDCAGTGGDAANTFNISTTAAIIAAGAGLKVSKNGGRRTTSKSGSVDVLDAMGFNLAADHKLRLLGLEKHNLAFFASNTTGTLLVRVKELCRKHGKTAFISLLGPLTSPIKLKGQIIGLGQKRWLEPLEGALSNFIKNQDLNRACLLRSVGIRLDELSSCTDAELSFVFGSSLLSSSKNAFGAELPVPPGSAFVAQSKVGVDCLKFSFNPEDLGLKRSAMSELTGADASANAGLIKALLTGEAQSHQAKLETACLNAALLLLLENDLQALDSVVKQGLDAQIEFNRLMLKNYQTAMAAVESGAVWRNFQNLLDLLRAES